MNNVVIHPTLAEPVSDAQALRDSLRRRQRLPGATYRLQLQARFTFQDAKEVVSYLARLGITDCYCSPFFRAVPGSTHGYDICDFGHLNPELGSEADYQAFATELTVHQMGQVLDFVPNHMAVDPMLNRWWRDVQENGPSSPFARFFDIDWDPVKPELKGKLLLPFLADHYGLVLEHGELQLAYEDGTFVLQYAGLNRPIDPRQYPRILRLNLETLQAEIKEDDAQLQEFLSILTVLDHLPISRETTAHRVAERQREKKLACERLARLGEASPRIRRHIEDNLREFNGQAGKPESFDRLHELLEHQPYRLAYWRTAFHEINYRRFFDIKELAGLRMEEPAVFAATHALVLRLVRDGKVTGLRLDHLDGLFDPVGYLDKLQAAILEEWVADFEGIGAERTDEWRQRFNSWREAERRSNPKGLAGLPLYVVAEKILSGNESLPESWPVHGTTGYDFLNDLNRLFINSAHARDMKRAYERFTGLATPFADVAYANKELITWTALASELNVLAHALNRISEGNRRVRDFTLDSLREALREVVACFPVYRTYVGTQGATELDRQMLDLAIGRARRRNPAMEPTVFDFLREVLLPQRGEKLSEEEYQRRLHFSMKFQQYSGPVQAKGVEDTAFYCYNVLVSLNEVGGDPQRFGGPPAQFHEANRRRLAHWPHTMLATATHDTKRGEDARARLNVLSEMPDEWRRVIFRWARINASHRTEVEGAPAPDRNDEYLFYQALLGAWPAEPTGAIHWAAPGKLVERLRDYMVKAVKEAKRHTSWINPNKAYDEAVVRFVELTLAGPRAPKFLAEFLPFQHRVAPLGMVNSLAQVVLKLVAPGAPDFYQGTELWDLSLVDPDNRSPVDFALRQQLLTEIEPLLGDANGPADPSRAAAVADLLAKWEDGRIKLFITARGLRLRQRLRPVFQSGEYISLEAEGDHANHVVALARKRDKDVVLAVVPRLGVPLTRSNHSLPVGTESWQKTRLLLPVGWETRSFRNLFTQERVRPVTEDGVGIDLAAILRVCPVALLVADS